MAKQERERRLPINGSRNRLTIKGMEPGYRYRIVNDMEDRVEELREFGYEIVMDKEVSVGDRKVAVPTSEGTPVRVSVGGGMKGYVMRIKNELFEENRAAHDALVDSTEKQMIKDAKKKADYGDITIG
jgi:predicted SPOUT superfamily RNA methylase MTH1